MRNKVSDLYYGLDILRRHGCTQVVAADRGDIRVGLIDFKLPLSSKEEAELDRLGWAVGEYGECIFYT